MSVNNVLRLVSYSTVGVPTSENHCLALQTNHCNFVTEALLKQQFPQTSIVSPAFERSRTLSSGRAKAASDAFHLPRRITAATLRGSRFASVFNALIYFQCAKSPYRNL